MKQLTYDILSRIPFYGSHFKRRHEPLFIYSNFFFDEPGSITKEKLFELVDEYHGCHPDEAITTEVINELLGAWEDRRIGEGRKLFEVTPPA